MTTSVTSVLPTQPLATAAPTASSLGTTAKSPPETSLASLADALMGLTTSTFQRSQGQTRMFARIERLVDSLAKLIEAFASLRSTTTSETSSSGQSVGNPEASLGSAANQPQTQQSQTVQPAPSPQHSEQASAMPCVEITQSVSIEQPAAVLTQPPSEQPSAQPSPLNLGSALGKTGGFLWKPVSEKNGDLVVLLPKKLTGKVQEVRVLSPDGKKTLGKGKYSGIGNGDREHFRFSKSGSGYPDGSIVYIKLEDGTTRHVKISDTSKRLER